MARSLYIHVPFCDSICPYCDFARTMRSEKMVDQWLGVICREIDDRIEKDDTFDTVYIGGGTPSCLEAAQFEQLVSGLKGHVAENAEFTIECNPESVTKEKLDTYVKNCVNRISLGVQSFHEQTIRMLGRHHTPEQIETIISMIRESGISNISIDLMFAVPGQTLKEVEDDLAVFFALNIPHLSIYSLIFEDNSVFTKTNVQPVDEDLEADEYERIVSIMKAHGFEHYEISSFAKNGMYSRHNLAYWNDSDFIGIGCGASGRENGKRYANTKSVSRYVDHGPDPIEEQTDAPFEAVMMGLRTMFGVDLKKFEEKYGFDLVDKGKAVLARYPADLTIHNGALVCTESGLEKLNTILVDFLDIFE